MDDSHHADFMQMHYNNQQQQMRDNPHAVKQGAVSHLVQRSNGAHALGTHGPSHGPHANSQSIRQKDLHAVNTALQNNFTAMANIQ